MNISKQKWIVIAGRKSVENRPSAQKVSQSALADIPKTIIVSVQKIASKKFGPKRLMLTLKFKVFYRYLNTDF